MKEEVQKTVPFFKTIWLALNPWRYDELRERRTWGIMKYFLSFVFLAFVLAVLLMLPAIGSFANNQMSHFEQLKVTVNTTMKSPVVFPENNPYITIDTRTSEGKLKEGKFLITDDYLYRKMFLSNKVEKRPLGPYKELTNNEWMVVLLLLLMTPSLLFLFYIGYTLKVLLVVLVAALLAWIVGRIAKFEIPYKEGFKAGLLAATPMIIIDLIRLPFAFNVYFAEYIAFLIFFIVGVIKVGEFEGSSPGPRKRRKGGKKKGRYIDISRKL